MEESIINEENYRRNKARSGAWLRGALLVGVVGRGLPKGKQWSSNRSFPFPGNQRVFKPYIYIYMSELGPRDLEV